tara:strand:- start:6742 stop:7122 length:381 start_codon:yes stop_codon:yes gene_type:complete
MMTMEQLKQFALDVHNFAFSTKYDDLDIVSAMDLDSVVEELNKDEDNMYKEIQELKKRNEELQEQLNEESQQRLKNKECWMTVKDKYWELNKENEELKEGIQNIIDVKDEEIKSLNDKFKNLLAAS